MSKSNPNRPDFVTKALAHAWQPFVDQQIRRQRSTGVPEVKAIDHALDLRDEHIRKGDKPPKFGRKK